MEHRKGEGKALMIDALGASHFQSAHPHESIVAATQLRSGVVGCGMPSMLSEMSGLQAFLAGGVIRLSCAISMIHLFRACSA